MTAKIFKPASLNTSRMDQISGYHAIKRAIEVAAVGAHRIVFVVRDDPDETMRLASALPAIGVDPALYVQQESEISIVAERIGEPSGLDAESDETIKDRISRARYALSSMPAKMTSEAIELFNSFQSQAHFDVTKDEIIRISQSVASLDHWAGTEINALTVKHVSEALMYVSQRPEIELEARMEIRKEELERQEEPRSYKI